MPAYSDGASPMAEHALKKERSFCRRLSRSRLRAHPGQLSFVMANPVPMRRRTGSGQSSCQFIN
jgi:hypothetical protein